MSNVRPCNTVRSLGFIAILLLLCINVLGLYITAQAQDWKGLAVMFFMAGLLLFFTRILWRGRQLSPGRSNAGPLANGWMGQSVRVFFMEQVAKSAEGRIFLAGACVSLIFAIANLLSSPGVGLHSGSSTADTALLTVSPAVAFVLYVQVCGPDFKTPLFKIIVTAVIAALPFYFAYR